jgi:hypothetical protein
MAVMAKNKNAQSCQTERRHNRANPRQYDISDLAMASSVEDTPRAEGQDGVVSETGKTVTHSVLVPGAANNGVDSAELPTARLKVSGSAGGSAPCGSPSLDQIQNNCDSFRSDVAMVEPERNSSASTVASITAIPLRLPDELEIPIEIRDLASDQREHSSWILVRSEFCGTGIGWPARFIPEASA